MIAKSDLIGKIAIGALAMISIGSWFVIVSKYRSLMFAQRETETFLRACNEIGGRLDGVFDIAERYPGSPLAQVARETRMDLDIEDWYRLDPNLDASTRLEIARIGLDRMFDRSITHEIGRLESMLIYLATTVSVCPFIGLFGTVWGIMVAFQGFGVDGSVSITALAPGLSTALLTTVGGLFCAIPASLAYNDLTNRVKFLTTRMDTFAMELTGIIQKRLLTQMVRPEPARVRGVI